MDVSNVFIFPREKDITGEVVSDFISKHQGKLSRYKRLMGMYKGLHEILSQKKKEAFKPDNRLVVNFAKYIVDTLNGYFIGKPIRITHQNTEISDRVNDLLKRNDQDDNNSELSKLCSIYGHAYEFLYQDEQAETCITYNGPLDMFLVYDDTIAQKPLFGVYYKKTEDGYSGSVYTAEQEYVIVQSDDGITLQNGKPNVYGDVPIIEYIENEERQSAFENVETLINAYNKAVSEKANDVDYFADAYMKILGAEIKQESLRSIRDNRIINLFGRDVDATKIIVEFMEKPSANETQENLIDRLERLIYQMSMVSNINDEDFGNASGVSLAFKLQSMENLALMKERKFTSAMNKRFSMIFALPTNISPADKDEWRNLEYIITRNIPHNTKEEAETVSLLEGIISKEDQLKLLSSISNVKEAIERLKKEREESSSYPDEFGGGIDGEQGILGETADSTVEASGEERETNAGKVG